tara:strand:+ start:1531 stop:2781 length:1251 start_codon:yes stop_codon:yes gene_type:complete
MLLIYQLTISLILILSPLIIFYRINKNKEDPKRYKEKFAITSKKRSKGKLIWFHGASVGELLSIIPIIKNYEKNKNIDQILITSSTLSSSKVLKQFRFKKTIHQFYPIDYFLFTDKFLKFWKPNLAVFIESEIWPYMFKQIQQMNIPLALLNARLTKKTSNRWLKINFIAKSIFRRITIAYPQNKETNAFFKKIKTNKIKFVGNLKFIETQRIKKNNKLKNFYKMFKNKKIWVASSTHNGEEEFCIKAHIELKKKFDNLITIIIPRHIHRVPKVVKEIKKLKINFSLHSKKVRNLKNVDIYIVDTFGETNKFHMMASSVFLGGSIIDRGGQNPLEAARHGAKILHGPNIDNFKDIYKMLKIYKASVKINSPKELAQSIQFKKNNTIGIKIKNIGEKILKKTIKELDYLINNEFKKT